MSFFTDDSELRGTVSSGPLGALGKGCVVCPLKNGCTHPCMNPYGKGDMGIVVVGEAPGETEDKEGRPFVGSSGKLLRRAFSGKDIDLDRDCFVTNVIQCRPKENKFPKPDIVQNCSIRLRKQLVESKPKLIYAVGSHAVKAVLDPPFPVEITKLCGRVIPSYKYNCWVACILHPSFVARNQNDNVFVWQWEKSIGDAKKYLTKPLPRQIDRKNHKLITDYSEAISYLKGLVGSSLPVGFDYETNRKTPYESGAKILSVSFSTDPDYGVCIPVEYKGIWTPDQVAGIKKALCEFLTSKCVKVIQNADFERMWSLGNLGVVIAPSVWDTMIANHVEDERRKTCSLEFMAFCKLGVEWKEMVNKKRLEDTPIKVLAEYNCMDSKTELKIAQMQWADFDRQTRFAAQLFSDCTDVLSDMGYRGINVDKQFLTEFRKEVQENIDILNFGLSEQPCVQRWPGTFNPDGEDLRGMLYSVLKCPYPPHMTKKSNKPSIDEEALKHIIQNTKSKEIIDFVRTIMERKKHMKLLNTYVADTEHFVVSDGLVHPHFFLHIARTFRSSSADPNLQNYPKRDKYQYRLRNVFIPKNDFFLEADFKGSEVSVMAMVSKDPVLRQQLADNYDFHRFWASRLFEVELDTVTDDQRFRAKNMYVFPNFYGSYFENTARNLLLPVDHVRRVDEDFWKDYKGIKQYHYKKMDEYNKNGFISMPLGFRRHGPLDKNQQINSEVQGTSFHLLLVGAQEFVERARELGLRSHLILEVHDSILVDVVAEEMDIVVELLYECLTKARYAFQKGVEMRIDLCIGENWYEMKKVA